MRSKLIVVSMVMIALFLLPIASAEQMILNYDPQFIISLPESFDKDAFIESVDGNYNLSFIPKELSFTNSTGSYKIKPGELNTIPLTWHDENRTGYYYGAFQNQADLIYRYDTVPGLESRLKEIIYVKNQSFFGDLTPDTLVIFKHRIDFEDNLDLYVKDIKDAKKISTKWKNETDKELKGKEIVFQRGSTVFRTFTNPYIIDDKGIVYRGNYSFTKKTTGAADGKGLIVEVEFNSNDLIKATYPLVLDPTIAGGVAYNSTARIMTSVNQTNGSGAPKYIGTVQSLASCGNYLYISDNLDDRISIYNVTNKSAITILGSVATTWNPRTASVSSDCNWVYLSTDYSGGFVVINATDKANPVITDSILLTDAVDGAAGSSYVESKKVVFVTVYDHTGAYADSIVSINVSDPTNIAVLDSASVTGGGHDVRANETVAITAGFFDDNIRTFNVTNVSDIVQLDTFTYPRIDRPLTVHWASGSQYAYVTSSFDGIVIGSLVILNVANFSDIKFEGAINYTFPYTSTFTVDPSTPTRGLLGGADPHNALALVDISDKKNPYFIEATALGGSIAATGIEYIGGYFYIGGGGGIDTYRLDDTPISVTDWDMSNVLRNGNNTFELDLQWSNYSFFTNMEDSTKISYVGVKYFNSSNIPDKNLRCTRSAGVSLLDSGTSLNTIMSAPAGGDDYLKCGVAGDFAFGTTDFTVSVNATTTDAFGAYIATRGAATGFENGWILYYGNVANKAVAGLMKTTGGNTVLSVDSTASVTDGLNHTITMTRCGDNLNIYVDGADKQTVAGAAAYPANSPDGLYVGNFRDPSIYGLIGTIDNVVIYPFCANDTQVLDIHQNKHKLSGNISIKDGRQLDAGLNNKWSFFRVNGTEWSSGSTYMLEINGSADNSTWTGNQTVNTTLGMNSNTSIGSSYQYRYIRPKFTMNASTSKYWSPQVNYLEFTYPTYLPPATTLTRSYIQRGKAVSCS